MTDYSTMFDPTRPRSTPEEVAAFIAKALTHHQAGRIDVAADMYREALVVEPDNADALHLLGMVALAKGEYQAALGLIGHALTVVPDSPDLHNNLAQVLRQMAKTDDAEAHYRHALTLDPQHAPAHNNLGALLQTAGRTAEAMDCYRQAVQFAPDYATAHFNIGNLLQGHGKVADAIPHFQQALALAPQYPEAQSALGAAFIAHGDPASALAIFQQLRADDPAHPTAQHMIAALSGEAAEQAPDAYVASLFDRYAGHFDTHLTQVLKCEVPQSLAALLDAAPAPSAEKWNVLDLGCGTGLVGAAIGARARQLVGVDLSGRMLEQAKIRQLEARPLYTRLVQADLISALAKEAGAAFDVVTAGDVFVYVGKLDATINEIKRVLGAYGLFAFSVETMAQGADDATPDYRLNPSGRFTHSPAYLQRLAADAGFEVLSMTPAQLRIEHDQPVAGLLALWRSH